MTEPIAGESELPPSQDLAAALEPVLREACEGRLGSIGWFRTDWQRGGGARRAAASGTVATEIRARWS